MNIFLALMCKEICQKSLFFVTHLASIHGDDFPVFVDVKLKMIENDVISPFQHLLSDLIEKCLEYIPLIIERAE